MVIGKDMSRSRPTSSSNCSYHQHGLRSVMVWSSCVLKTTKGGDSTASLGLFGLPASLGFQPLWASFISQATADDHCPWYVI